MTAHAPRTHSGCCRALVANMRCSECSKPAPWRTRLTAAEAQQITARLARPVAASTPEARAAARPWLYPEGD